MKRRLFVGLPMTDEAKRGVESIVQKLKRKHWKVRWSDEANWHVTIAFVGCPSFALAASDKLPIRPFSEPKALEGDNTDDGIISVLSRVVREAAKGVKPFELKLKGVSSFPQPKQKPYTRERVRGRMVHTEKVWHGERFPHPKVIWVRLGGELEELQRLSQKVRRELREVEIEFDPKPLVPHITLGRVERTAGRKELEVMTKELSKLWEMKVPQSLKVDEMNVYESKHREGEVVYDVVESIQLREK